MSILFSYLPMALVFLALIGLTILIWRNDRALGKQIGGLEERLSKDPPATSEPTVDDMTRRLDAAEQKLRELSEQLERLNIHVSGQLEAQLREVAQGLKELIQDKAGDAPAPVEKVIEKPVLPKNSEGPAIRVYPNPVSLAELVGEFNAYADSADPAILDDLQKKYGLDPVSLDKWGKLVVVSGEPTIVAVRIKEGVALLPAPGIVQQFKDKKHRPVISGTDLDKCYDCLDRDSGILKIIQGAIAKKDDDDGWTMRNQKGILHGFV